MAEKKKFQEIKGTRDVLPPETELWNRVEQTAREVFGTFGFGEIRPPIFEQTELFARAVGGETDIVSKEMYTFEDRPLEVLRPKVMRDFDPFLKTIKDLFEKGVIPTTTGNAIAIGEFERNWEGFKEFGTDLDELAYAASAAHDIALGPDVPAGAAAEGALPPVLSNWRGSSGGHTTGAGRGQGHSQGRRD